MNIKEVHDNYFEWSKYYRNYLLNRTKLATKKGWQSWQEPFKTWTQEFINEFSEKAKQDFYPELIKTYLKERLLKFLENNLIEWRNEAIQQGLIDNNWQIAENDTDELIYKLVTTLTYENRRHALQQEPCISIVYYLRLLEQWLISKQSLSQFLNTVNPLINSAIQQNLPKLSAQVEIALSKKETEMDTYFGSYPSDDSDSDEEEQAKNDSTRLSFRNYKAKQLLQRIKEYEPITTTGGLYATNVFDKKVLPPRWLINHANLGEEQYQDLLKLNELLKQGISIQQAAEQVKTKFFVAQYRGIAYSTSKWNKPARKNHRDKSTNNEVGKPQYSTSVYKASDAYPYTNFFKLPSQDREYYSERLQQNAQLLKQNLLAARRTRPVVYNNYVYNHKAHYIQEIYTRNYNAFHQTIKQNNFGGTLINDENPLVSTGNVPKHALEYAYGTKYYEGNKDNRLRPRWRKNGQAERPYAGKVYVSLHAATQYDEQGPFDIPILSKRREISPTVINNILHERECSFPAVIEGEFVIAQHVAKFPSFKGDYKNIYLYKYGLTQPLYNLFKQAITNAKPHQNKVYKLLLSEWLCLYHEVRLIDEARQAAEKMDGVLVYHNQDGSFGLEPDSPDTIGTMTGVGNEASRQEMDSIAEFRQKLADILIKQKISEITVRIENNIREKFTNLFTELGWKYFNALTMQLEAKRQDNIDLEVQVAKTEVAFTQMTLKTQEKSDYESGCWYMGPNI